MERKEDEKAWVDLNPQPPDWLANALTCAPVKALSAIDPASNLASLGLASIKNGVHKPSNFGCDLIGGIRLIQGPRELRTYRP